MERYLAFNQAKRKSFIDSRIKPSEGRERNSEKEKQIFYAIHTETDFKSGSLEIIPSL